LAKETLQSEPIMIGSGSAPVRFSFLDVYEAKQFGGTGPFRFKGTFLLDNTNAEHKATIKKIKDEALALIKKAGKDPKKFKLCWGNGDEKDYDGYAGMTYLNASNGADFRPLVVNRRGTPVKEGEPGAPYSGSYGRGKVTLWLQDNQWGQRINANLRSLQSVSDGEAFGKGAINADDEFEPLEDGETGTTEEAEDAFG
jgi:hypothetical protein